jgi:pimeloyl-ACP methyl ester carboxylesterase
MVTTQLIDLLGFSIGSFVAQEVALIRPDLVRRVVRASSASQGAAGMHGWAIRITRCCSASQRSSTRCSSRTATAIR